MTGERWQLVKEVFNAALDLPKEERAGFVRERCGADEALREELELLLASHEEAEDFIETPALVPVTDLVVEEPAPLAGTLVGAYRIERELGRGGMGAVYLATRADDEFRKQVAIKLIKRGFDTDDIIRRFRNERQILAGLDHPNVTRLLDGGTTEAGLPYLVMDYVEGAPLHAYCDERRLSITDRLDLFLAICSAVAYAHRNLIVHRDIKPSNIVVTPDGVPKLLDFGIAKLTTPDAGAITADPTVAPGRAMTPEYASPEQFAGEPVTTASDIYSLGVVLYELLSGHRPYRLRNRRSDEIARLVHETDPLRPSTAVNRRDDADDGESGSTTAVTPESVGEARGTHPDRLQRVLRGDLDNIVLMAMRKEPERRYSSVEQFAADIGRYLGGLPVIARQDTFSYRAGKFVKRNKAGVVAGCAVGLTLVAGIVSTSRQARIARRQRDKAERINRFLKRMLESPDPRAQGKDVTVVRVLGLAAESIEADFADQPDVAAELHTTIGLTYLSLGLVDAAEPHLRAAHEERARLFGHEHRDTAMSLNNLGQVVQAKGDLAGALPHYRGALDVLRRVGDEQHMDVAEVLGNLGHLLFLEGEHDEAVRAHREEIEIRRALQGAVHPDVARAVGKLANVLGVRGDQAAAEPLHRQALAIMREWHGEGHLDIAQAIVDLVGVGYPAVAAEEEPLSREALSIRRTHLGPEHPDTAWALYRLGYALFRKSDVEAAERCAAEILALRGRSLPNEHILVNSALLFRGICLLALDEPARAEPCFRESLELRRSTLPPDHWLVAAGESHLGECLARLGHRAEAESLLVNSYRALETKLGPEHHHTRFARERIERCRELLAG